MQDNADDTIATATKLPFIVELWTEDGTTQVLGRAESITLAQAIFKAAQDEHPHRRLTLRNADYVLADTRVK